MPLLSACMIVKDEEDNLPSCLASLEGLVDEVVVYDTGSTDRTVGLARSAGATVVEGYWDDDFARARNAALAHCRGRWVLHVDADEVLEADPEALRALLRRRPAPDAFNVSILNLTDQGETGATAHRATRLFRRSVAHWTDRLHEQVVRRSGSGPLVTAVAPGMRIVHSGYQSAAVAKRDKLERNIRLARADLERGGKDRARLLLNLGRSFIVAGRHEEALACFEKGRRLPTSPVAARQTLRFGAETLLSLGRPQEALEWVDALEAHSTRLDTVRSLRGVAHLNLGDAARALEFLEGLGEATDDDGITEATELLRMRTGLAAAAAGRWELAADELLAVVQASDVAEPVWAPLLEAYRRTGRDLAPVAAAVPTAHLTAVLGQVLLADPVASDELVERLWERLGTDARLLAFGIRAAPRLRLERATEWSARLRGVGLERHCPLVSVSLDRGASPVRRAEAALLAHAAFGEGLAPTALQRAAADVPPEALGNLLVLTDEVAPALLGHVVEGAAATPARCLVLARLLDGFGASEEAIAVLDHGIGLGAPDDVVEEAAGWLREARGPDAAERLRALAGADRP